MEKEQLSETGGAMVRVTVKALETTGTNSSAQTRDLLISSTGQCKVVSGNSDVQNQNETGSPPVSSKPTLRKLSRSTKQVSTQCLVKMVQHKEKRVDTTPDVLGRYHTLYLHGKVPTTVKVRAAIHSGLLGHILISLEFLAAVLSIVAYLNSTYSQKPQHWAILVRRAVALFFVADYILKLYSAPVRLYYFISVSGLIDLLSTLSILSMWHRFNNDGAIPQMLLVFRALRILPAFASLGFVGGAVNQHIFLLTIYTLGAVFIAAGILQWVEFRATSDKTKSEKGCDPEGCFTFYDAFYFIIVTIATVGYGDFSPNSSLGRLITIAVIIIAALILPVQINKILQLASRRPYGGKLGSQKVAVSRFVIINGNVSLKTVRRFLAGFYHPNHAKDMAAFPVRAVVMAPFKPSYDMKALLNLYGGVVQFIEGTPTKESDLKRVRASLATAVFLLLDDSTQDFEREDTEQITRALAVHRHCGPNVRVITELRNPENFDSPIWDETEGGIEITCPEATRFQLLSRSCYIQGFSTFVINLFRSGLLPSHANPEHWMKEYSDGFRQSIFPVILPSCFHEERYKFEEAAELVYRSYGGILIGLDVLLPNKTRAVRLYPRGRLISSDDIGMVIARDLQTAKHISKHKATRGNSRVKQAKHQDMEMGVRNSSIEKQSSAEGSPRYQHHKRSFAQDEADQKADLNMSSLEEAIEAATRWPPLRKQFKPGRPLLERRADVILENLEQNSLNLVMLPRPHFLLCIEGEWPFNLFYLISSLRSSISCTEVHPVVILHPGLPGAVEWGSVALFPEVFFVRGSGMCELDLVRAGVFQAMKVVVLTERPHSEDSDTTSLDVKNIVIAATVERLLSPATDRVLVELQQEHQLQFVRPHFKVDEVKFEHRTSQRDPDARLHFAPAFASGKGLCPGAFTFMNYATFFNSSIGAIIQQLCSGRRVEDDEDAGEDSVRRVEQIPVPERFIGSRFCEAFQGLLDTEKGLLLGIYRHGGSSGSFVSTNPAPSTLLASGDLIYVFK